MVKDGATTGKIGYWKYSDKAAVNEHVYIFRTKKNIENQFLFRILQSNRFKSVLQPYIKGIIGGVSLEIKNIQIPLPPLEVQQEIVAEIEGYQKIIDGCRQVIDAWKPDVETYLDEELKIYLAEHPEKQEELSEGWPMVKLGEVCEKLFAGGDVPEEYSKIKNEYYNIPIYTNGIGEKSLYGYTNIIKVNKECITISARGTIGYSQVRKEPFYPAIRLIVVIPLKDLIDVYF